MCVQVLPGEVDEDTFRFDEPSFSQYMLHDSLAVLWGEWGCAIFS